MTATIMIIDDSKMIRTMVRDALAGDEHRIVEAGDGREALALAEDACPDLVITDVNMPEMDGLTFIDQFRRRPDFSLVPILVLTTEAGEALMQRGRALGATGWITKPFEPSRLRELADLALALRARALRQQGVKHA
jgi:two-component system chemotaxis response regulator CheY